MTNIKQKVLTYKDWNRDDIHFGYIFNVTYFNDKSWIIKIDAVPSTHSYYGTLSGTGKKSYRYPQYNGRITGYGIVNDIKLILDYSKRYPSPNHINRYIEPLITNCSYYITSSKLTKQGKTIIYNLVTSKQDSNILIAFEMCKNLIREREDKLVKEVV